VSLQQCAAAAIRFPNRTITTPQGSLPFGLVMLCIGGPESNWNVMAQGDTIASLEAYQARTGVRVSLPPPWAVCHGASAWGWLQINWSHYGYIRQQTGSSDPCAWAAWLYNPYNTVAAAIDMLGSAPTYKQIFSSAGWLADEGLWANYLPQAQPAWEAALAVTPTQAPPPPVKPTAGGLAIAAGGLAVGGVGLLALEVHRKRHR
jgi:hypothetical protein